MRILLAITGAVLVACGDDGGGGSAVDAATDAYDTARCLIRGNYGALGGLTGTTSICRTRPG